MTPFFEDAWLTVYGGDCRAVLATLPAESIHCVVTSPPYWGLRDYGAEGQLGLEKTPEQYVENMVAVFREVRRVLRNDGTAWLNLGDSYAGSGRGMNGNGEAGKAGAKQASNKGSNLDLHDRLVEEGAIGRYWVAPPPGLKPKDLVGIPWRVAFALQADGWYLRSDIIWSKPNPMPESVTDRPTKSHEYLFLLSKAKRYFFDADSVRIPPAESSLSRWSQDVEAQTGSDRVPGKSNGNMKAVGGPRRTDKQRGHSRRHAGFNDRWDSMEQSDQIANGANIRSVWTVATQPYPGAHFATFPPKLVEPCIKAGTSERGVCPECGAPWRRVVERETNRQERRAAGGWAGNVGVSETYQNGVHGKGMSHDLDSLRRETTGWQPSCAHTAEPAPAQVLDPFAGSGTVGMVAQSLSRRAVLIDLNPEYLKQQLRRNAQTPLGLSA